MNYTMKCRVQFKDLIIPGGRLIGLVVTFPIEYVPAELAKQYSVINLSSNAIICQRTTQGHKKIHNPIRFLRLSERIVRRSYRSEMLDASYLRKSIIYSDLLNLVPDQTPEIIKDFLEKWGSLVEKEK